MRLVNHRLSKPEERWSDLGWALRVVQPLV
jgi:hypothetical protein